MNIHLLSNSNELLSKRVLSSLRNTYKEAYMELTLKLHYRRHHEDRSNLGTFDPRLNALTTQPWIQQNCV